MGNDKGTNIGQLSQEYTDKKYKCEDNLKHLGRIILLYISPVK